jgi:hypothetical protein
MAILRKTTLGRPRRRWTIRTAVELYQKGRKGVVWIEAGSGRIQGQIVLNVVINFKFS